MAISALLVDVGPLVATITGLGALFLDLPRPQRRRPSANRLPRPLGQTGIARLAWPRARRAAPPMPPLSGLQPGRVVALERLAGLSAMPRHAGVGRLVQRLAMLAGLDAAAAERLQAVVPLYDIGNVAVPSRLLQKQGPFDDAELDIVRRHAVVGARLLGGDDGTPLLQLAAEVALCHHERWDGSGYPRGLAGAHIPLAARIVAIVDVFEATLSPRPGEAALPLEAVIELVRRGAGMLFDPVLTGLFLDDLPAMLVLRDGPSPTAGDTGQAGHPPELVIRRPSPLPDALRVV